mgnify:CR=1 FL=1
MSKSKRNMKFMHFINSKYKKELNMPKKSTLFYDFDDYALYLFYEVYHMDTETYYYHLEEDLREYVNLQMKIKPRKRKMVINGSWAYKK